MTFRPLTTEKNSIYLDWVDGEPRARSTELSGGRIGYLHIPDMGADGIREFIKWYYPQIRKEGADRRRARQRRRQRLADAHRAAAAASCSALDFGAHRRRSAALSAGGFYGPMVALLNEDSGSDGDIFPSMFREAASAR